MASPGSRLILRCAGVSLSFPQNEDTRTDRRKIQLISQFNANRFKKRGDFHAAAGVSAMNQCNFSYNFYLFGRAWKLNVGDCGMEFLQVLFLIRLSL